MPYSEGVLGADAAAKVERHLSGCPRCAAELEMIRSVTCALGVADVPAREPANDLWAKVSARIADEPVRTASSSRLGIAAGFAAAVLVGALSIKLMSPTSVPVVHSTRGTKDKVAVLTPATSGEAKPPAPEAQPKPEAKPQPREQAQPESKPTPPANRPAAPERKYFARSNSWYYDRSGVVVANADKAVAPAKSAAASGDASRAIAAKGFGLANGAASARIAKSIGGTVSDGSPASSPARGGRVAGTSDGDQGTVMACSVTGRPSAPSAAPAPVALAVPTLGDAPARVSLGVEGVVVDGTANASCYYAYCDTTTAAPTTSVVDELNETEGIRTAAIFSY